MKYTKGRKLFSVFCDSETGEITLDTYVVRTIRKEYAYAVLYIDNITWGFIQNKQGKGSKGWLNPIDPVFRKKININSNFPLLCATKLSAYSAALKYVQKNITRYMPDTAFKLTKSLKSQITRLKNEKR